MTNGEKSLANWLKLATNAGPRKLIIVRGPSGSGKSHLAKQLAKQYGIPEEDIRSTDKHFTDPITGQYNWQGHLATEYHRHTQSEVKADMYREVPVIIVDNTNTQMWQMKPYVELAQKYGYDVEIKEPNWGDIKTPEGKWNINRLIQNQLKDERVKNQKIIPPDRVREMAEEYEYNPTIDQILKSKPPD